MPKLDWSTSIFLCTMCQNVLFLPLFAVSVSLSFMAKPSPQQQCVKGATARQQLHSALALCVPWVCCQRDEWLKMDSWRIRKKKRVQSSWNPHSKYFCVCMHVRSYTVYSLCIGLFLWSQCFHCVLCVCFFVWVGASAVWGARMKELPLWLSHELCGLLMGPDTRMRIRYLA